LTLTSASGGIQDVYVALSVPSGSMIFAPGAGTVTVVDTRVFPEGKAVTPNLLLNVPDSNGGHTLWSIYGAHGSVAASVKKGDTITKTTGAALADQPKYTLLITGFQTDKNNMTQPQETLLKQVFGL
jgi:hypothetical protein